MINRIGKNSYKRIKNKIDKLGYSINPLIFIYMRLISSLLLFIVLLFFVSYGYIISPIVTVLYYILVENIILDGSIKIRKNEIESDSVEFMPIFLLSLKSGRNIKKALYYTTEVVDNSLSSEFKRVLHDSKIGKSFDEALIQMKERIPSDLVNNMIVSIIEANRLGNNINDSINTQLSYIEEKKKRKILNTYRAIPIKIAIVSVIFVFLVLLLLVFNTL